MPDDQNQNQQSDNTSGEQNQSQNQNPSVPQEGDGNPPSWREALPADLKSEKTFEKFNDVPSLAKSYLEAQKAEEKPAEPVDKDLIPCTCHLCEEERLKRLAAKEATGGR